MTKRADPQRLEAVVASRLLLAAGVEAFDRLTTLAKEMLHAQAAFLSIVAADRDYYLSEAGFEEPLATTRQIQGETFCHHVVDQELPVVIPDTRADLRYRQVPTVESLGIAAYIGIPVRSRDGSILGSLCVIDSSPRAWSDLEVRIMVEFAASAEREIALAHLAREALERADAAEALALQLTDTLDELKESHWHIRRLKEFLLVCASCHKISMVEAEWEPLVHYLHKQGIAMSHGYCPGCFEEAMAAAERYVANGGQG